MQYLCLLVADRIRLERDWRLHRGQADELHDVVGHHVPQRPRLIVIAASLFHAHGFAHGNLHVIDVSPVPDRLEDSVGETKGQNILNGFLAQVVVDAVNLLFARDLEQLLIQGARRIEVASKRFFDDHSPPLMIVFGHQTAWRPIAPRWGRRNQARWRDSKSSCRGCRGPCLLSAEVLSTAGKCSHR